MSAPFRLSVGSLGPRQQSPTTCGPACAAIARMLVDAPFGRWILHGEGQPVPGAEGSTVDERFASWERTVQTRTNGWVGPGRWVTLPWPRSLGTPPWGLRGELENGATRAGTRYRLVPVRGHFEESLRARYRRLTDLVVDGEPAALYVGNHLLPRHIGLVLPGAHEGELAVYEPGSGRVLPLVEDDFATRRLDVGGWSVPWVLVQPTGHRRVGRGSPARVTWGVPRLGADPTPEALRRESVQPSRSGRGRISSSSV